MIQKPNIFCKDKIIICYKQKFSIHSWDYVLSSLVCNSYVTYNDEDCCVLKDWNKYDAKLVYNKNHRFFLFI